MTPDFLFEVPGHMKPGIARTIFHELGHHVISISQGFDSAWFEIEVFMNFESRGCCAINISKKLPDMIKVTEYLKSRIMILAAGELSSGLFANEENNLLLAREKLRDTKKYTDALQIHELCYLLENIDPTHISISLDDIFNEAERILIKNSEFIQNCGNRLLNQVAKVSTYTFSREAIGFI
jgi:hypothetical protein